jgi:penicillin-binding protein 1C
MQVVRLLAPRRRTWRTKLVESFRALQLERATGKDDILALYLNRAPYGGNVVGAEAAARLYFGKPAADLTLGEAALLAGVPQHPARFHPRRHLAAALERRGYVLDRMEALGQITPAERRAAEAERVRVHPRRRPAAAPRYADFVLARHGRAGRVLATTHDAALQALARRAAAPHAERFRAMGIDGMAVVVIDVAASSLPVLVGSMAPDDPATGQVNAAAAPRQPGSLLKPFLYAAAFDAGRLTPQQVVYDVPTVWRGYAPRNFDRRFGGAMPAARALRESRNLPAVRLLARLRPARLAHDVRRLGLAVPAAETRCGLSLALGTAEIPLLRIANAYAALARLGRYRPLRVLASDSAGPATRVYSPGAAWMVLDILASGSAETLSEPAWKTGTSWNHRDAWAVAVTPRYVTAVWVGRLSGRPHPALVGAGAALPVALEIAAGLPGNRNAGWPRPPDVAARTVCALSGAPPGAACPHGVRAAYLPGVSTETPCPLHRFRGRGAARRAVTVWPAHAAPADTPAARPAIAIVSPELGARYLPDAPGARLSLVARAPAGSASLYWFLDGVLLARAPAGTPVAWPMAPGVHELLVADGRGAAARTRFTVVDPGTLTPP